jgi:Ca2+-binding RTX toxin-like protein
MRGAGINQVTTGNDAKHLLSVGGGAEVLVGGDTGRDSARFNTAPLHAGADLIAASALGQDRLVFSAAVFGGPPGIVHADAFRIIGEAANAQDRDLDHATTGAT